VERKKYYENEMSQAYEYVYETYTDSEIDTIFPEIREKTGDRKTYKELDKILKKVGEECTELIIAAKADDKAETIYEVSDLCYHVMVMMIQMGISLEDIHNELASRHVIDKKVKQEKMTGNE
jgi:phosphoribosyl-ATP pyrophosphohydrolase